MHEKYTANGTLYPHQEILKFELNLSQHEGEKKRKMDEKESDGRTQSDDTQI